MRHRMSATWQNLAHGISATTQPVHIYWASTPCKLCSGHGAWATTKKSQLPLLSSSFTYHPSPGHLKSSAHLWTCNRVEVGPIFQVPLFSNLTDLPQEVHLQVGSGWLPRVAPPQPKGPVATASRQAVHLGSGRRGSNPYSGLLGLGRNRI